MDFKSDYFLWVKLPNGKFKYRSCTQNYRQPNFEFQEYIIACFMAKNPFYITEGKEGKIVINKTFEI